MTSSFWRSIANTRIAVCIFCGFSSGMPLYLVIQMLPAWLRDSGVDLKTIGLFSLAGLPWTLKFLWAPLMDRYVPPFLGRRRGWALATQVALMLALLALSPLDPRQDIGSIAAVIGLLTLFSASQDIVLDAHRRELLPDEELGFGNSMFVNAYRISSLVPGSLALILADQMPWSSVHIVVAAFMGVGIVTSVLMPEPAIDHAPPRTLIAAVVEALTEFYQRRGLQGTLLTLAFVLFYKLGDNMAVALATPFYLDLGFTKTEIGTIAKVAALWASIAGGIAGGIFMIKLGINRALWVFGFVQMFTILGFAALSEIGANPTWLFAVVSAEYLGVGLGTAALVAFIARSTDKRYTAFQFALLTAIVSLPRTFASATTGYLIEWLGYTRFFLACTIVALPGMMLLPWAAPFREKQS